MAARLPTYFIPHGGGPCFFMDWDPPDMWDSMEAFLAALPHDLPATPKAILVASGHWEEADFTFGSHPKPPLIYDYYGFPPHTYELTYDAPGAPDLAARAAGLLGDAGVPARLDDARGYDHGVFIPLKVAFPDARIPVVQMSLKAGLDPQAHIRAGQALSPLRDEGVLIVGSGMSYHNLRRYRRHGEGIVEESDLFDRWLGEAVTAPPAERNARLAAWDKAPAARLSHPTEEHLIPLMVAAGAAGEDPGRIVYSDRVLGAMVSGYRFG